VLDHGCGEGILKQHLNAACYSRYLGVDLSSDAVAMAMNGKADEKSHFVEGNVETFQPDGGYDIILFNEVLYYLKDPLATVMRYEPYLNPRGVIIVSMFDMMKSRKVWRQLDTRYAMAEASRAVNHGGHSWSIRVYRRSGDSA
jgi:2-polyprenyl-6-hydroxyphenyl methylase/3-demethylubiquinone-9 3-methyltransferase